MLLTKPIQVLDHPEGAKAHVGCSKQGATIWKRCSFFSFSTTHGSGSPLLKQSVSACCQQTEQESALNSVLLCLEFLSKLSQVFIWI